MKRQFTDKLTLFDRLALGFLNLIVSLPTGLILWFVLNGFPWAVHPWLPVISILWFTIGMTLLGFFTNNNLLVNFYAKLWRVLVSWFRFNQ